MKIKTTTFLIILVVIGIILVSSCAQKSKESLVACPQDAKLCPDGSSVGRIPPSCEFVACPGEKEYESTKSAPPDTTPYVRPAIPEDKSP